MDLKRKNRENADGIHQALYGNQCQTLVNTVMNFRVP